MTGSWAGERSARGTGDGPIAAAFTAISEITGRQLEVLSLQLRSLTPGRDSVGQVFLQVKVDGKSLSGHGASHGHRGGERARAGQRAQQGAARGPAGELESEFGVSVGGVKTA